MELPSAGAPSTMARFMTTPLEARTQTYLVGTLMLTLRGNSSSTRTVLFTARPMRAAQTTSAPSTASMLDLVHSLHSCAIKEERVAPHKSSGRDSLEPRA